MLSLSLTACPPDDGSISSDYSALKAAEPGAAEGSDTRPAPGASPSTQKTEPTQQGGEPSKEGEGAPPVPPKDKSIVSVCLISPSVGPSKDEGAELRRGLAIAQAEIKGQAWRKFQLEWTEKDSKSTEGGAIAAYHECFGEGHSIIIGPMEDLKLSLHLQLKKEYLSI